MIIAFIIHHRKIMSCFAASFHNRSTRMLPAQHLVWDQGAERFALWSHMDHIQRRTMGSKGSVWLGDIWLRLVLCNPQPSPSAFRPRCAKPARLLTTSNNHWSSVIHGFLITPPPLFLVPITRHTSVRISHINTCESPSQFGSAEGGKHGRSFHRGRGR